MNEYVLSSSARVEAIPGGRFAVTNGVNVQLTVSSEIAALLREFSAPRDIDEILESTRGIAQVAEMLDTMKNLLILVPAACDDEHDMRLTWNCLAQGSDRDAAYVIDNETRTMEEFALAGDEGVAALNRIVPLEPNWHVVNIGCGMGRLERPLSGRVAHIHGFDVADKMIERARTYLADCPNVRLTRADCSLDAAADDSIDLVISFLVFQHCPQDITWRYMAEAYRVLRPGGRLAFQILCYDTLDGYESSERSPIARYYGAGKARYREPEVRERLACLGFRVTVFRDGDHAGDERRLSGTACPGWHSKLIVAIKD